MPSVFEHQDSVSLELHQTYCRHLQNQTQAGKFRNYIFRHLEFGYLSWNWFPTKAKFLFYQAFFWFLSVIFFQDDALWLVGKTYFCLEFFLDFFLYLVRSFAKNWETSVGVTISLRCKFPFFFTVLDNAEWSSWFQQIFQVDMWKNFPCFIFRFYEWFYWGGFHRNSYHKVFQRPFLSYVLSCTFEMRFNWS